MDKRKMPVLAHAKLGHGATPVIVLHDWFSDRTSWDPLHAYLSLDRFTYIFADLRGYGESRAVAGSFTLEEAVGDVVALADHLQWETCALVAHSMTTIVAQRLAQRHPGRLTKLVLVGPVPPTGIGISAEMAEMSRRLARADDERRLFALRGMWGERLSESWIRFKARRWRETAAPEAAAAYVDLFGDIDISGGARGVKTPMLLIAGAYDAPPMRPAALESTMRPFYPHVKIEALADSGHYPMQEAPPLTASLIERFLGA